MNCPKDERVRKTAADASIYFTYFSAGVIAIRNVSAGTWTDLIYGPTGLLAEVGGTQTSTPIYRLTDHVGSIAQTTDNSGNQIDAVSFLPYGQTSSGSTSDPPRFTSLLFDTENGSYHADYRQHSPAQGRWLTPDPYSGSYQLTNPQSLNRYAYVSGQPLSYTDPSGLSMFGLIPPEAGFGNIWAEGIILGIDALADLFSLFGHHSPPFHGSLTPRPSSGIADFPNGESLGIPTGMNVNFGGPLGAILPATSTCEFGACGGGMSLTPDQQTAITNAAKSWFGTPYAYGGCLKTGADCSGSVYAIYLMAGIKLPRKFSSGEYRTSPLFKRVTDGPQVGDVGWYPGHVVIYGGVTGPNGEDVWSATHTGGHPFGPAKSSSFGTPTWYRYIGP